jgi:hypothetical protein
MKLARWAGVERMFSGGTCFIHDGDDLPECLEQFTVVLGGGTEERASELLALGAERVLLADAALLDSTVVERLAQQHGTGRIGVWLAVKKQHISWSIDYVSNEDFNCLTPSMGKGGWDVLKSDATSTGTDAEWWVGQMLARGASMALISVDLQDEDLNICAGLIETHSEKLWFTPLHLPDADLEPWVRYGKVRQLVLPAPNVRDEEEMARICAAAMVETESHDIDLPGDKAAVNEGSE